MEYRLDIRMNDENVTDLLNAVSTAVTVAAKNAQHQYNIEEWDRYQAAVAKTNSLQVVERLIHDHLQSVSESVQSKPYDALAAALEAAIPMLTPATRTIGGTKRARLAAEAALEQVK